MKTFLCAPAIVVVSTLIVAGCASQSPKTAAANPGQTTYTQEDLQKTGRQQTGDAVQALDPSVRAVGGR